MRSKLSISLSNDSIKYLDSLKKTKKLNRSKVIEQILMEYKYMQDKKEKDLRDWEILQKHRAKLNRDAEETLELQECPW